MVSITEVLKKIASRRPVFHSEADFQHAFAWELHRRLPTASIRLELPISHLGQQRYLDVWVSHEGGILAIELKYKTRALSVRISDEQFSLKDQSAQDLGRYDFIRDIRRLEQYLAGRRDCAGYAVLLTNDSAYWTPPRGRGTLDADFRVHQGRSLHGTLTWRPGAATGTIRGREEPIELDAYYAVDWESYSQLGSRSYGRFRYLAVKVVT